MSSEIFAFVSVASDFNVSLFHSKVQLVKAGHDKTTHNHNQVDG